ncbi:YciL protein [Sphingobium indicum BiD32]|uniref:YciL protein n=1 Tax=Sphingobium indicum BiD32 TaxID=1301087 RepID=N1MTU8_9SPHN|nr:YciI family protein [Sphingobium indicum]CCW19082.1 YciL protein [Sphingobium indicum BiD32]
MFYAVIARDRPHGQEQRNALRSPHFDYLNGLGRKVVFAGALFGDDGRMDGSLMVVEAESLDDAKALAAGDPFAVQGLYASWEVKRWTFAVDNATGRTG